MRAMEAEPREVRVESQGGWRRLCVLGGDTCPPRNFQQQQSVKHSVTGAASEQRARCRSQLNFRSLCVVGELRDGNQDSSSLHRTQQLTSSHRTASVDQRGGRALPPGRSPATYTRDS